VTLFHGTGGMLVGERWENDARHILADSALQRYDVAEAPDNEGLVVDHNLVNPKRSFAEKSADLPLLATVNQNRGERERGGGVVD